MIGIIQPPNFLLEINRELMFRGETGQREMFFSHLLIFWFLFFSEYTFSFLSSSEWTFCVYWVGGVRGSWGEKEEAFQALQSFSTLCNGLPLSWKAPGLFCLPVMILIRSRRTRVGSLAADSEFGPRLQHFLLALMQLSIFGSARCAEVTL